MNRNRSDEFCTAPVTALIPCYRCRTTVERAIHSVAKQTMRPAELVLVEDRSDDGTLDKLQTLRERYGRDWISVIALRQNSGVSAARNAGWAAATQPYIALLDADDSWHPRKIEIQYTWMAKHWHVGLTGHRYVWLRTDAEPPPPLSEAWAETPMNARALMYSMFPTSSVMFRRALPFRFTTEKRRTGDTLFYLQVCLSGITLHRLELPLAYLYKAPVGAGGLSGDVWANWIAHTNTLWRLKASGLMSTNIFLEALARSTAYFLVKVPYLKYQERAVK